MGELDVQSSKSKRNKKRIRIRIERLGLENEIQIVMTGCFGLCEAGPIVIIYPEGTFYSKVQVSDAKRIAQEHLLKGRIIKDLLYKEAIKEGEIKSVNEVEFYAKQTRLALRNWWTD